MVDQTLPAPSRASRDGPVLEMAGIDKAFGGVPALRGANLSVQAGEVHALIGQNGAGKSTLIKILNGAYRKDAGTVRFEGRDVAFADPHDAQEGGISTIFQEINLVGFRSIAENIALGHEPRRFGFLDRRAMRRRAEDAVAGFGLDLDVSRPLDAHNTAIQQLVAIARAVSFDARLVIMDEPTSSLDEGEKQRLFSVIRTLKARGVAVVYVSHHLDELFQVADRVTVMRDGETVATRPMAAVKKIDLVALMLGRDANEIARSGATGFGEADKDRTPPAAREIVLEARALANGGLLKDASFLVHRGEIVGLAGLLGSGRSEAARSVFGLDRRTTGTVTLGDAPRPPASPREAVRRGLAFLSEDRKADGIIPDRSVAENMTLALLPRLAKNGLVPKRAERELVDRFIAALGIRTRGRDQPIRELSGGNQQKVLLARWLAVDPRLLILDEPTRGIDVGAKAEIQRLIGELAGKGMAVLMISSEFEELVEGADRIVVMQDGVTVAEIDGDAVSEEALIAAVAAERRAPAAPEEARA